MKLPNEDTDGFSVKNLLCLVCCPPWPPKIAEKIAFKPPKPTYSFSSESPGKCGITFNEDMCISQEDWERVEWLYAKSSRRNRIACAYVRCHTDPRYTILFSHGNASDLGLMLPFYFELCKQVCCNLFSYDYSGYGASSGRPSQKNMYADIDCAWDSLTKRYGARPEQIILYGQSLGTVPTVDLAARRKVAAVVLHSPLMSALRLVNPDIKKTWCCDTFSNIEKVPNIVSPVLVIHGYYDDIVPFCHGLAVFEKCPCRVNPLWVTGAGHNSIECRVEYIERLKKFVTEELQNNYTEQLEAEEKQLSNE